jgi:tyrosine-specific transport protein
MYMNTDISLATHHGIFRQQLSLFQAVALIVSGTIGAGILGIPYAIAQVGWLPGFFSIILVGLLMMGVNLLIARVVIGTKQQLHFVGLAERYLGRVGKYLMSVIMYGMLFGILVVYILGVGESLAVLLGWDPRLWSTVFFLLGAMCILFGLRTIKSVEFFLSLGILCVVLLISVTLVPSINTTHFGLVSLHNILVPYGVLLFAFHGTTSLPEAYSLVQNREKYFMEAVKVSSVIVIAIYALFTFVVLGVTGPYTTEIATVGLGQAIGPIMLILGNIFAVLAMGTSYLVAGLALRDSLVWDIKVTKSLATAAVTCIPYLIFLFWATSFVGMIDFVGGVFMTSEIVLLLIIYVVAKRRGDVV